MANVSLASKRTLPPRFILAKYAPDLARMEPRNIGVIVWHNGTMATRFLNVADAVTVGLSDARTYERWIAHWSQMAAEKAIRPRRGKPVPIDDPCCIDTLVATQKGNYILVDAGELLKPIRNGDLQSATDYLFDDLVATRKQKMKTAARTFRQACHEVMKRAEVIFKERAPVPDVVWKGSTRTLHPDYYIGNGKPSAIFQQVDLSNERSVNASALLVDILIDSAKISSDACRFLVRSQDITTEDAEAGLRICKQICGYIDVDSDDATKHVRDIVESSAQARPRTAH